MRLLLILLAAYHGLNGIAMLAAPATWYALTPGADHSGPLNTHFVRDIGLAFIAASVALSLAASAERPHRLILVAVAFLGGHAGLHAAEMLAHGTTLTAAVRDVAMILVPGLAPLAVLLPRFRKHSLQGGLQ